MKKIFLIAIITLFVSVVSAQTAVPRWGTTAGRDNTFRGLGNAYITPSDTFRSRDTLNVWPNAYNTFIVNDTIYDTLRVNLGVYHAYLGDMVVFYINPGKNVSKHLNILSNGTNLGHFTSFTANRKKMFVFFFDGTGWVKPF